MLTYNIEDLKLKDALVGEMVRYTISIPEQDKIDLIDTLEDEYATKLFALKHKYEQDLAAGVIKLRQTPSGDIVPNSNSLRAWIRRNDTDYLLDNGHIIPELAGKLRHKGLTNIYISDDFHHVDKRSSFYTFPEIVDELFLTLLQELKLKEKQYFKEHDEYEVKKQKVRDFANKIRTTFNYKLIFSSDENIYTENNDEHNSRRCVSLEELDQLISKYEEVENLIKRLSK